MDNDGPRRPVHDFDRRHLTVGHLTVRHMTAGPMTVIAGRLIVCGTFHRGSI